MMLHISVQRKEHSGDVFWLTAGHIIRTLTFKGRMLDISNAACTPHWPNVRYI
jgi:hypothetical protein